MNIRIFRVWEMKFICTHTEPKLKLSSRRAEKTDLFTSLQQQLGTN